MSDLEFDADVLNIEQLISEVEQRPALYNKMLSDYNDRHLKESLWAEVCARVVKQWNDLPKSEKQKKAKIVQKKWKNVRDCFIKELTAKTRGPVTKKRKYVYFDSLKFLIPTIDSRLTKKSSTSLSETVLSENNEDGTPSRKSESNEDGTPSRKSESKADGTVATTSFAETSPPGVGDEEYHFAMMLIPMLQKLNEEQKHFVKIEILNAIWNAKLNNLQLNHCV